ncbi:MAG: hypothetical protein HYY18_01575 [Planctomycetes bacterium]|nr:hypothetical protein [Planctomycetota bacterium]
MIVSPDSGEASGEVPKTGRTGKVSRETVTVAGRDYDAERIDLTDGDMKFTWVRVEGLPFPEAPVNAPGADDTVWDGTPVARGTVVSSEAQIPGIRVTTRLLRFGHDAIPTLKR